jgi:hypothetical protein
MIYGEGVLYPNDAHREELRLLEEFSEFSTFDVRNYKKQMEGMPVRKGDCIVGHALDVYFDEEKNLCVFFQLGCPYVNDYYTHLELCYKVVVQGGKIYHAYDFSCCIATQEHALYKKATFRILTHDVRKERRRYCEKNLFLYGGGGRNLRNNCNGV